MNEQTTLWVFQKGVNIMHKIVVRMEPFPEPIVFKRQTSDALLYVVDFDTYHKWNNWYALKAKEIVQNVPTNTFTNVYVFEPEFYTELSNLNAHNI